MRISARYLLRALQASAVATLVATSGPAHAATVLADSPLFLTVAVPPNIVLTLDDSGSMARGFVPDICPQSSNNGDDCTLLDERFTKSAYFNPLYYNPTVKYVPGKDATGVSLSTSFTAAEKDGFDTTVGTVDLSRAYKVTAALQLNGGAANELFMAHPSSDFRCNTTSNICEATNNAGGWISEGFSCGSGNSTTKNNFCKANTSAYYYVFAPTRSGCTGTLAQKKTNSACYNLKLVSSTSGTTDFNGDGTVDATEADERQNFANWYSFARTRNLATVTAASLSFATLDPSVRVAWQSLNSCRNSSTSLPTTTCAGWRQNVNLSNSINTFSGSHKNDFYTWISQLPSSGSTPLPAAMDRAGRYYQTSGENSPYDNDFTTSSSGELACRRNYHVMMTDGIWNQAITAGNQDGSTITLPAASPDGITQYTPRAPYQDTNSSTLADIAFKYWITDLRGTLNNRILPTYRDTTGANATINYWNPRNDPATWQHMVNFTIGLGLSDYLSQVGLTWTGDMYGGSYPSIAAGTTAWPTPGSDLPENVSDLWHAAINSRGQFFSATDPASLSKSFQSALTAITDTSGSSAALSANSTSIQPGNTYVYQAKFNAKDWSGTLLALAVGANGKIIPTPVWDASTNIPSSGTRKVFSWKATAGFNFNSCSNLSAAQKLALDTGTSGVDLRCTARLNWLRGDPTNEVRNGGTFRNRTTTVMGDVINSDPAYVKDVDYGFSAIPRSEASSYASFVSANGTRQPMVYVGANDGMMHAIYANTGVESFAYVPAGVYSKLSALTDPSYVHKYYVDGAITVSDAYLNSAWKTVLVAGLNGGGNSVYALDVTDPTTFDATKVMWEYTEADMGNTFSQPQIGVLESGQWVAVFGNGYNSTNGGAYLYVVDLRTGTLLKKIMASDVAATDESNGLSTPRLIDSDGNHLIDTVYAGDLAGNMWKFNLNGSSSGWGVAYGAPLFRAGAGHPITAQPKVGGHPSGGKIVVFGTGRYLTSGDVFDTTQQTFYGIWDNGGTVSSRAQLVQQVLTQGQLSGQNVRTLSNNTVDWATKKGWYIDLPTSGERVASTPLIFGNRVIFISIIPSTDPCSPGGTSWLVEAQFVTGGTFTKAILDVNDDGSFENDALNGQVVVSQELTSLGISKTPVLIGGEFENDPTNPNDNTPALYKEVTGTSGGFGTVVNCGTDDCGIPPNPVAPGVTRRSWIQIR